METLAERAGFASSRQLRRAWGRLHDVPPSRLRGYARAEWRGA
jgi:transcriptional regulator GlxA family with amidase domain